MPAAWQARDGSDRLRPRRIDHADQAEQGESLERHRSRGRLFRSRRLRGDREHALALAASASIAARQAGGRAAPRRPPDAGRGSGPAPPPARPSRRSKRPPPAPAWRVAMKRCSASNGTRSSRGQARRSASRSSPALRAAVRSAPSVGSPSIRHVALGGLEVGVVAEQSGAQQRLEARRGRRRRCRAIDQQRALGRVADAGHGAGLGRASHSHCTVISLRVSVPVLSVQIDAHRCPASRPRAGGGRSRGAWPCAARRAPA